MDDQSREDSNLLYKIEGRTILMSEQINEIKVSLENKYVTRVEYESTLSPIRNIVYGLVGIILVAVVGALIALVLK